MTQNACKLEFQNFFRINYLILLTFFALVLHLVFWSFVDAPSNGWFAALLVLMIFFTYASLLWFVKMRSQLRIVLAAVLACVTWIPVAIRSAENMNLTKRVNGVMMFDDGVVTPEGLNVVVFATVVDCLILLVTSLALNAFVLRAKRKMGPST